MCQCICFRLTCLYLFLLYPIMSCFKTADIYSEVVLETIAAHTVFTATGGAFGADVDINDLHHFY